MSLDVELYRRTVYAPAGNAPGAVRRLSALDLAPDGADRAMVLIHGYGGRALQWIYQLRAFGQTMRVVAPDLRGHGQTDDPDAVPQTMDSLVADLELLLERLTVPRPFALVAHSFGGAVATEYALRHPDDVSQLVLIAVPTRFILRPGTRPMMSIPEPVFETVVKRLNIALYASPRTLRRMHDGAMSAWRGDQRMPELRVPTLVILGQRDTVFDQDYYAGVARAIPGAKQVVIPVSAHLVQLERAEATNRAIRRFIAAHPGESTPGAAPAPAARASLSARYAAMPWLQAYDPEVPETIPTPRGLLHELVSHAASDFPDRSALVYFGQRIGYRELDHLSNRFAHALRKLGVAKGDRVAIVLPNVPQCVIAFYGTLKAGAVVVLGSPLSTEEEIDAQVRDAGARVVLTLSAYRSLAARVAASAGVRQIIYSDVREYLPLAQRVALASLIAGAAPHANPARAAAANGASSAAKLGALPAPLSSAGDDMGNGAGKPVTYAFQELLRSQPATPLDAGTTSDDLALLQYTSGTTGSARGVMLTHANLVVNTAQTRHWIPSMRRGKETLLCVLPLSHSYGLTSGLNLTVALAGTLVLLPTTRIEQILKAIKRYHPSLFPGIPALYLAIANYPHVRRYGVAAIRVCVSGSAPLPVEAQEAFEKLTRGRLVEGYGLTEASPVTHSNPLNGERRAGTIGLPYPSTDARIVDTETSAALAPGAVGELVVRGPQVMRGYWNKPDETAQALDEDGWLHTGDLARMDEDGFFTIVDRKRDVILAGPYNVYPRDVEEVLYEHPKVLEAAVVGAPDPADAAAGEGGTRSSLIKAVVVLKRGERATADELLALCRERLDAYKVPKQVEFRTELPKNFVGKVLRRLLVEG